MNKTELIAALRTRNPWLRDDDAHAILDSALDIIGDTLAAGEDVVITGFGTFGTRSYSERVMQNPHGGEPLDVPSGRAPTFRPGAALRRRVQADVRLWPVHR